jgi:phosphoribosyl-dephospho-CoA transferase
MKELSTLKEDIVRMKQTAVINSTGEGNMENIIAENEILKAKIIELEG